MAHVDDGGVRNRDALLSFALLVGIAVFVATDLVEDYYSGLTVDHFLVHVVMLALAVAHGLMLWKRLRAQRLETQVRDHDLEAARLETERWRKEASAAIRSLGDAIDQQLTRWQLTDAEREV